MKLTRPESLRDCNKPEGRGRQITGLFFCEGIASPDPRIVYFCVVTSCNIFLVNRMQTGRVIGARRECLRNSINRKYTMNKLIATLVAATFAMGTAFAQTPAKPAAAPAAAPATTATAAAPASAAASAKAATSATAAMPAAPAASASAAAASAPAEKAVKKVKHAKKPMKHEAAKDAKKEMTAETAKPAPTK